MNHIQGDQAKNILKYEHRPNPAQPTNIFAFIIYASCKPIMLGVSLTDG